MKILLITQDENIYLPQAFGIVCHELSNEICAIVSAPAMSTHGGFAKGIVKHLALFRFRGTLGMVWRLFSSRLKNIFASATQNGPWYSIKHVAESFKIPFFYVKKIQSQEFDDLIKQYQPDLLISISCPQIIRKKVRDQFPLGCINVHGAPLPKYRGLMPAFWMLLNQETQGATTVHVLDEKLDDGDIILQVPVEISSDDTWDSLVTKTKMAGAKALIQAVKQIEDKTVVYYPNDNSQATYFSFPTAEDAKNFYKKGKRFF